MNHDGFTLTLQYDDLTVGEYCSHAVPRVGEKIFLNISEGSTTLGGPLPYPTEVSFFVKDILYQAHNIRKLEHWHKAFTECSSLIIIYVIPQTISAQSYVDRVRLLTKQ